MDKKNKKQAMFIKTQDATTYEELVKIGFQLVDYTDGTWTFVNKTDCPLTFDNNKITYSDMLCF